MLLKLDNPKTLTEIITIISELVSEVRIRVNKEGFIIVAPGDELTKLFETTLKRDFTQMTMKDLEQVTLTKEEITALYYADFLAKKQHDAAKKMGISQPSFSRELDSAHSKIADAFFRTKSILFEEPESTEDV